METEVYALPSQALARIATALGLDRHQLDDLLADITYHQRQRTRVAAFLAVNPVSNVVLASLAPRAWTGAECRLVIHAILDIERAHRGTQGMQVASRIGRKHRQLRLLDAYTTGMRSSLCQVC